MEGRSCCLLSESRDGFGCVEKYLSEVNNDDERDQGTIVADII